jgi:hypothetical protein
MRANLEKCFLKQLATAGSVCRVCLNFCAFYRLVNLWPVLSRMQAKSTWTLGPDVRIMAVEREGDRWVISADAQEIGSCP